MPITQAPCVKNTAKGCEKKKNTSHSFSQSEILGMFCKGYTALEKNFQVTFQHVKICQKEFGLFLILWILKSQSRCRLPFQVNTAFLTN